MSVCTIINNEGALKELKTTKKRVYRNKIKVFKRGASYAAREKGAKRGSKRDKRDAVTPAAGSGGQGDEAGDRATLRDRVGRRAEEQSGSDWTPTRYGWTLDR